MNTQKIKQILDAIETSREIQISDMNSYVVANSYWTGEIKNDPAHFVLEIQWVDDEFQVFDAIFSEQSLSDAVIEANRVAMKDESGTDFELGLFDTVPHNIMLPPPPCTRRSPPCSAFKCFACSRMFTDTVALEMHEQNEHPTEYNAAMANEIYGTASHNI